MSKNRESVMRVFQVFGLAALVSLAGCAHGTMRGSVAMKASDSEAHVCMGDKDIKAGDKVSLFKNVCAGGVGGGGRGGDKGSNRSCEKVRLGSGVVERTLNEHYSVVKVDPGVQFEEGAIVEKE